MTNEEAITVLSILKNNEGILENEQNVDALITAISALELVGKIDKLERERDAAIADLKGIVADSEIDIDPCYYCKYVEEDGQCFHDCNPFSEKWGWEWRGVKE